MRQTQFITMLIGAVIFSTSLSCMSSGIYKLVDERGHVTYTNTPVKGARKLQSNPPGSVTTSPKVAKADTMLTTTPADHYPKVNASRQQQRDIKRRQILEQELAAENELLENTLQTLNLALQHTENQASNSKSSTSNNSEIQRLRNQVTSHERNIQALKTELKSF